MISVWKVAHSCMHLNSWSLAGDIVFEGFGVFGYGPSLTRVDHLASDFEQFQFWPDFSASYLQLRCEAPQGVLLPTMSSSMLSVLWGVFVWSKLQKLQANISFSIIKFFLKYFATVMKKVTHPVRNGKKKSLFWIIKNWQSVILSQWNFHNS